jgi:hypothetical protein
MPQIHDTDNYTVPGGIKLFFNDGSGERDLGNMVDVSMARESEDLEHYTNRPGARVKDKIIALSESLAIDFSLDEPVIDNFVLFFKGDTASNQSAGTATSTDQEVTLPGDFSFKTLLKKGAISAYSARQFLDYVYMFDGVSTYTNHSVEADTAAGTPFTILADNNDKLYCGKATQFKRFVIDVQTAAVGYTAVTWEYWNGSTWTTLTTAGTADFSADGTVTFTIPGSWAKTTVNGINAYWIRAQQTAASPATPATLLSIGRGSLAENTDVAYDLGSTSSDAKVRAVSGSTAVYEGEEIKVTYTYPTYTAQITNIAKVGSIEGSARLEVHPQSGRGLQFDIEIPKCQIKANGDLSLNDQEFMAIPLSLVVLDDTENTPTHPYGRVILYDAQA